MEYKEWIVSFDIGKNNFAFYIEEVDSKLFENILSINVSERYEENGTVTKKMSEVLNCCYGNGKTILYVNEDLTIGTDKSKYLDNDIYYNMNDHLDKYISYFEKCSYVLIEKQMKKNTMAMKLGQHCLSYMTIKLPRSIKVFEFSAYLKTQILGAERLFDKKYKNGKIKWKTMDQRQRKKWAVEKGLEILKNRKEIEVVNDLIEKNTSRKGKKKVKLDDILDNKLMIEAFKFLYFIEKQKSF
jgi:hypothetical protein